MTLSLYVNMPLIGLNPRELNLYTNNLTESLRSDPNRILLQSSMPCQRGNCHRRAASLQLIDMMAQRSKLQAARLHQDQEHIVDFGINSKATKMMGQPRTQMCSQWLVRYCSVCALRVACLCFDASLL